MASRRSRIKGIANIPQRRKPTTELNGADDLKCDETNLNLALTQVNDDAPQLDVHIKKPTANINNEQNINNESNSAGTAVGRDKDKPCAAQVANISMPSNPVNNESNNLNEDKLNPPQVQPSFNRRRALKPAISLAAIRKSSTPACISSPNEDLDTPKPQEEPSPPENANLTPTFIPKPALTPAPIESPHVLTKTAPIIENCINKEISVLGITKLPLSQNQDTNLSDNELARPPPACSPSKYNRARIRAVPRLGQRRPSFSIGSASESEDESKKSYKTLRVRNDSVCSSMSTPAPPESPAPLLESANSSRKKPEFNSVIQRKCRRTEQSRKLAEARRDFQQKFSNGKPDRQKLTMIDLIFYNPSSSPMSQKRKRKDTETESIMSAKTEQDIDDAPIPEDVDADAEAERSDEENTVPAPQITIGANGEIIIDEKSLFIENKDVKRGRELLKKSDVVDGDKFESSYGVFKRIKRSKDWNKDETLRFYKALNTLGTDFTLMCGLFPGRSRREIKMKFKKEERVNRFLVDRAVMQPIQFDITDLERDLELQELAKLRDEQIKKDKEQYKEEQRLAKEKQKEKEENGVEKKKKRKSVSVVTELPKTPAEQSINAKEALKNKLRRGINSLIMSDDSDVDENSRDASVNGDESKINENNNHIKLGTNINLISNIKLNSTLEVNDSIDQEMMSLHEEVQDVTSSQVETIPSNGDKYIVNVDIAIPITENEVTAPSLEKNISVELPSDTNLVESNPSSPENMVEGSIVVSPTLDENGKESYKVFTVNKDGNKLPLEITPDVLDVLLKNQKQMNNMDENDNDKGGNADESVILPSDTTLDNIMADISLSTIHDHPELNLTTDCMILSFDDIDTNIVTNATANIVAIHTSGP